MATWPCPPRTRVKLELLQRYLGAWFSIIARRFPEAIYFDAFAGPGEYSTGEDGSPIVALKQAKNVCADQTAFRPILVFSDNDPAALENLTAAVDRTRKHEHIQLFIEPGGFDKAHQRISELRRSRPKCPIFSFVDPFGIKDIPLSTILDLLGFESSECFINLMSGWSNRFIDHPDERVAAHVQNLLGGNFTREVLTSKDRIGTIIDIYRRQLSSRAKYVRAFKLYDEGNVLDNALIFAGNNVLGFIRMKEAMWKLDPVFGNSFSAHAYNKDHHFVGDLFGNEPQTGLLGRQLKEKLTELAEATCCDLRAWVNSETDFLEKHLGIELTRGYERGWLDYRDPENRTKRRNDWPERIVVRLRR
jgi:three-Cys-motif partner protein